jgi:hypothetical protein
MDKKIIEKNGNTIVVINSTEKMITDTQAALDLIMTQYYESGSSRIALNKDAISEDFFILSTRLAGEILQKFINYHIKFAVYGDFSTYTSKPLRDFMYESNHGSDVFFVTTEEDAVLRLACAK